VHCLAAQRLPPPGGYDWEGGEVESAGVDVGQVSFDLLGSDELGGDQAVPYPLDQGPVQLA
jgi:hypothetical protein